MKSCLLLLAVIAFSALSCGLENDRADIGPWFASSTAISLLAQSAGGNAESETKVGVFCNSTVSVSGAVGGWSGVQILCSAACDNSSTAHMCTAPEIILSLQFRKVELTTAHWVAGWGAEADSGGNPITECHGYSVANANRGSVVGPAGNASSQSCSSVLPIACCDYVALSTLAN